MLHRGREHREQAAVDTGGQCFTHLYERVIHFSCVDPTAVVGAHLGQQAEALFGLLARGDVHGVDRDAAVRARIDPVLKPVLVSEV